MLISCCNSVRVWSNLINAIIEWECHALLRCQEDTLVVTGYAI